jgi:hypothetical protein
MHPHTMEILADQRTRELRGAAQRHGTAPRHRRHVTPGGSRGSVRNRAGRTLVEVGLWLAGASADD